MELFKSCRNEWRNKSTHDYKLFFDNNEAFIAITSVSSFTHLLLNQIIEKISFAYQLSKIKKSAKKVFKQKGGLQVAAGLFEIITQLLYNTIDYKQWKAEEPLESELIGFLKANFSAYLINPTILEEVNIGDNLRPDFIIEYGGDKIILEVKKFSGGLSIDPLLFQLLTYLEYSNINQGIALALDVSKDFKHMNVEGRIIESGNMRYTLRIISN